MWQKHLVFPDVPRGYWRRFRRHWGEPLRMLEEVISISESLGADATSPRFETMDGTYCLVLRSLHARTCLHARSVLALLSNGLVEPAWAQWRICHEASTIASFIANRPDMAVRYERYSDVNRYHLAKQLYDAGHGEGPTEAELSEHKRKADSVQQDLQSDYEHRNSSRDYGWSGLSNFKEIEAAVFHGKEWNPRGEYKQASDVVHSAPIAGEPANVGDGLLGFVVGPTNSGLTGPADCTSLSILMATESLLLNASCTREDEEKLNELIIKRAVIGAMFWVLDPEIICDDCGGYRIGALPPELIPVDERPEPCSCGFDERIEEGNSEQI